MRLHVGSSRCRRRIQREYGRLVAVTVDEPYVNGALRAGLGASFPFLSDEDRAVATELDVLERTDETHRPHLPMTYVLDSLLRVHAVWCGFWYWGNPTPDELRTALRDITRAEQPSFEPRRVWSASGVAPIDAGLDAEGDLDPRVERGARALARHLRGTDPRRGDDIGLASVDGRPWLVHRVERRDGRVAIHVRKTGEPHSPRLVKHRMTVPPSVR